MSSVIVTPANFAPNLAMYMDAAAIGIVPAGLEDGRIFFDIKGSEPAQLDQIIEINPNADRRDFTALVKRGNSSGIRSDVSKILFELNYVQSISDATVRQKDRKGNFRKEADASFERASRFSSLPDEELGAAEVAEVFLKSAFLYTSFTRFEDRTRSFDLFVSAAKCFRLMRRHTAAATVYELACEMLKGHPEEVLTILKLRRMAAEEWQASVREYVEPDSMRFRIFRGLVHSCFMPSRKVVQELLLSLSNQDFEDGNFLDYYSNNIRRAYAIADHEKLKNYEWRTVKETLEGAALTWSQLEGVEMDISEELMQLTRAAETFAAGKDQYLTQSVGK